FAILALIAYGIYLACQTEPVSSAKPVNKDLLAADDKRLALSQMISLKKPGTVTVTDDQFAAYISTLQAGKTEGSGIQVKMLGLNHKFIDGAVKIEFLGAVHFGDTFTKN